MITIPLKDDAPVFTLAKLKFILEHDGVFMFNSHFFRLLDFGKCEGSICEICETDCVCDDNLRFLCEQFDFVTQHKCLIELLA